MTDIDSIEARIKAATPGPWAVRSLEGGWDGVCEEAHPSVPICAIRLNHPPNATLIAAAPTDLRALVAEVRRLRTIEKAARGVIDHFDSNDRAIEVLFSDTERVLDTLESAIAGKE